MRTNHTCPLCQNCSGSSLNIRLTNLPYDERLAERIAYVNSVCAALIDSRFGPGRVTPLLYHDCREPVAVDRDILFDFTAAGPVPSYTILPDSEVARRYAHQITMEAIAEKYLQMSRDPPHDQPTSPQNLARGSP